MINRDFIFNVDGQKIIVNSAPDNIDEWYVIKAESYAPDREGYITAAFNKDFPDIEVKDFEQLMAICSRSKGLTKWLSRTNVSYSLTVRVPEYIQGQIEPNLYDKASKTITEYNKVIKNEAAENEVAAIEYRNKLNKIQQKYSNIKKEFIKDKIIRVLTLTSDELPVSIQLAIENYTPDTNISAPDKRKFVREMLLNYKKSLVSYINANPECDIEKIIESLMYK